MKPFTDQAVWMPVSNHGITFGKRRIRMSCSGYLENL
uniref:Uncharacterized protein n=1 Tax=Anguilla anguilla TaxID=7936 RepID=A0A0E9QSI2_ANGAN